MSPLLYRFMIRIVIPTTLIFAIAFRTVCMSYFYLVMFFLAPMLRNSVRLVPLNRVQKYLMTLIVISAIFLLTQVITQTITLAYAIPERCSNVEYIMQQIGLLPFVNSEFIDFILWILPNIVVFNVSLCMLVVARIKRKEWAQMESSFDLNSYDDPDLMIDINRRLIMYYIHIVLRTSAIFAIIALFFAGTLRPSLPGLIYFIVFLIVGTNWAFNKSLRKSIQYMLMFVSLVLVLHLLAILTFQLPVVNSYIKPQSILARLIGLEVLSLSDCETEPQVFQLNDSLKFDSYLSPITMMIAYYISVLSVFNRVRFGSYEQAVYAKQRIGLSIKESNNAGDASMIEQFFYILCDFTAFIYRHSYLLTNITMLSWSIIYHSWLTFVLLILANVLWMIPNQRRPMMRSSLFLIFYAEFLLLSQYVYSMDLKETELPTSSQESGVNWEQIGFMRPQSAGDSPWEPLFVKSAFLVIFWITARQYCKEEGIGHSKDMLTDVFGSRHHRMNKDFFADQFSRAPRFLRYVSEMVSNFLIRIWTWLLSFMLFVCAMCESKMSAFRICYMALFLLFLMVFQMSHRIWLRFIYGYWLFVIFYAIFLLTLIYTYQFDQFGLYFEQYLKVSKEIQSDIGLRRYETKELFLRLLIPTLTLIFTVIQLHYFQRRFILSIVYPRMEGARPSTQRTFDMLTREKKSFTARLKCINTKRLRKHLRRVFRITKTLLWRFLDLHMMKLAYLTAFFCAAGKIVFIHVPLVFLCVIGVSVARFFKVLFLRMMLFFVAIYVLMTMIYQLHYFQHSKYATSCPLKNRNNVTVSSAEWLGMYKSTASKGLMHLLAPYIIFYITAFIQGVVKLRQKIYGKALNTEPSGQIKFLFKNVTRGDAEKGLGPLMRFLCNYGFYKFGWEITLIALVFSICYRRDIVAALYVVLLIVSLLLSRKHCARFWPIVTILVSFAIFLQFLVLLSFPPSTCWVLPWQLMQRLTENWVAIPENFYRNCSTKLKFDFVVLMLITRQSKAFRAETRNERTQSYPGGNNKNALPDIRKLGHETFVNPTHDFCSHVRNYADIVKVVLFGFFLWVTIPAVLLAGVCGMDLLSLGYLLFALMFLLKGSEVYLMNIDQILCRWNFLIAFNIFNIAIRATISSSVFMLKSLLPFTDDAINFVLGVNMVRSDHSRDEVSTFQYGAESLFFSHPIYWHAIVFAFIIFQRRIFTSYYFCHVILDSNANHILASRGATVIRNLWHKQNYGRREHERRVLEKIKTKMEQMREANRKSTQRLPRKREFKLHPQATRSGDYYMFDGPEERPDLSEIQFDYDFLDDEARYYRSSGRETTQKKTPTKETGSMNTGTNTAESTSDDDDDDEELNQNPIVKLMKKFIVLLTIRLNRFSRNYRYVHKILSEEKKKLQEISIAERIGLSNTATLYKYLNAYRSRMSLSQTNRQSVDDEFTTREHNVIVQMLIALWYAILANTELLCYLAVVLNQTINSAFVSLPLALAVLLWGSLTLPRPTKTFWVVLITYTLAMIFFKTVAHQRLQLFSDVMNKVEMWEFQIFLKDGYATVDLLLLVILFWHRYMLKKQGIWTTQTESIKTLQNIYRTDSIASLETFLKERGQHNRNPGGADNPRPSLRSQKADDVIESDISDTSNDITQHGYYKTIETKEYLEGMKRLGQTRYCGRLRKFFFSLLHKVRLPTDVYAAIFFCDFVNFFVLLIGYNSFVSRYIPPSDAVFHTYISENKVPFSFLIMLFIQFLTIVIERAIYLRKALKIKVIFHFITVIVIHAWIFFIVPMITGRSFGALAPVLFYIIKSIHMLFSSYQIRRGYPTRILGNFFTKSFSLANLVSFSVYMEMPFLYILRTLLDWVCIDTTLSLVEWFKMEDIYQSIFKVRCYRQLDSDFPVPRGIPKTLCSKLQLGGTILCLLVLIIWSPMMIFAIHSAFGKSNTPTRASLSIEVGSYGQIYNTGTTTGIRVFSEEEYETLSNAFKTNAFAKEFLALYKHSDISSLQFGASSETVWGISPPDRQALLKKLESGGHVDFRLTMTADRAVDSREESHSDYVLTTSSIDSDFGSRKDLISMLKNNASGERIRLSEILPKFVVIRNQGRIDYKIVNYEDSYLRPLLFALNSDATMSNEWWDLEEVCNDDYYEIYLENLPKSSCNDGIIIYAVCDKKFPPLLKSLAIAGMISLYTTFILFTSRFLRSWVSNNHRRIMFEDLPFADRVLKLCYDIYLVREAREWRLEEELYAKLLFLYRSPETLIKVTRPIDDRDERRQSNISLLSDRLRRDLQDQPNRRDNQEPGNL